MSNLRPTVIKGSIIDLPRDPRVVLKWVTNSHGGAPIKQQPKSAPPDEKPKDLGEERHHQLLSALHGLKGGSSTANVTEALQQNRDWRS